MSIASATAVTCPATFSSAIVRLLCGVDAEQIEAPLGRLAGERPRQGDDRPQTEQDRQEVADAPGQEAAQRLEVDRLSQQAAQRQWQRRQPGDELAPELDGARTRGRRRMARRSRT